MTIYFSGTDTGQFYQAGRVYENGNGQYRANGDGSFTNLGSGRTAVGSRDSDTAVFINTNTGMGSSSGSGAGQPRASSGGGSGGGAGPGNAGAVIGSGQSTGAGAGNPGAVSKPAANGGGVASAGFLSMLRMDAVTGFKTTTIYVDGKPAPKANWSDGGDGEDRWGEWGGALYGLGVMVADGYVGTTFKADKASADLASAAADFGTFVLDRRNGIKAEQGWDAYTADKRLDQRRAVDTAGVWQTGGGF